MRTHTRSLRFMRGVAVIAVLILAACRPLPEAAQHTSANSLDWAGVYQGVLPCADCAGIETTLRLSRELTYELSRTYLGKSTTPFSSTGTFEWRADGRSIVLQTRDGNQFYRVEENRLRQLDQRGEPITGALADKYVLNKRGEDKVALENTYWKLLRLGSTPVVVGDDQPEPHFILHPADQRVSGSGGCNRLLGSYALQGDKIVFSKMAATRMACANGMEQEQALHDALGRVTGWRIQGQTLELSDASGNVIAQFEARDVAVKTEQG